MGQSVDQYLKQFLSQAPTKDQLRTVLRMSGIDAKYSELSSDEKPLSITQSLIESLT
jgi:hypothetical protein